MTSKSCFQFQLDGLRPPLVEPVPNQVATVVLITSDWNIKTM